MSNELKRLQALQERIDKAEQWANQVDYSRLTDEELLAIIGDDPAIKTMSDAQLLAMLNSPHSARL